MQVFFFSFLVSVAILVSISTVFAQLDNLSQNHTSAHSNSFYSAHSSKSRSRSHALFLQAMHISRLHSIKHNISSFSISQILRCRMLFDLKTNKLRIVQGSWIWKKRLLYRKEECSVTKVGGLVVTPIFRWIHQRLQICNATEVRKFVLFFPIDVYDDALARKLRKLICVGLFGWSSTETYTLSSVSNMQILRLFCIIHSLTGWYRGQ